MGLFKSKENEGQVEALEERIKKVEEGLHEATSQKLESDSLIQKNKRIIAQKEFILEKKRQDYRSVSEEVQAKKSQLKEQEERLKELESELLDTNFRMRQLEEEEQGYQVNIKKASNLISSKSDQLVDDSLTLRDIDESVSLSRQFDGDISSKEKSVNILSDKYEGRSLELEAYNEKIESVIDLKHKLETQERFVEKRFFEVSAEVREKEFILSKKQEELTKAENALSLTQSQLEVQLKKLASQKEKIEKTENDHKNKKTQVLSLQSKLDRANKLAERGKEKEKFLAQNVALAEKDLREMDSQIVDYFNDIEVVKNNIARLSSEVNVKRKKVAQKKDHLKQERKNWEALNEQLLTLQSEEKDLESRFQSLDLEMSRLKDEEAHLSQDLLEKQKNITQFENRIGELVTNLAVVKNAHEKTSFDHEAVLSKFNSLTDEKNNKEEQIRELNSNRERRNQEIEEYKSSIENLQSVIAELTLRLEDYSQQDQEEHASHTKVTTLKRELIERKDSLEVRLNQLTLSLKEMGTHRNQIEKEINDYLEIIERQEKELLELAKKSAIHRISFEGLTNEKEKLSTLTQTYAKEIADVKEIENQRAVELNLLKGQVNESLHRVELSKQELKSVLMKDESALNFTNFCRAFVCERSASKLLMNDKVINKAFHTFVGEISKGDIFADKIIISRVGDQVNIEILGVFEEKAPADEFFSQLKIKMRSPGIHKSLDFSHESFIHEEQLSYRLNFRPKKAANINPSL